MRNVSDNLATCCKKQHKFINDQVWGLTDLDPSDVHFVQAGSNCGSDLCAVCGENIWADAVAYGWNGTVVEAHPLVYHSLVQNYKPRPGVVTVNAAITTENGIVPLYSPAQEDTARITSQISSINKDHLHTGFKDKTLDIALDQWQGRLCLRHDPCCGHLFTVCLLHSARHDFGDAVEPRAALGKGRPAALRAVYHTAFRVR